MPTCIKTPAMANTEMTVIFTEIVLQLDVRHAAEGYSHHIIWAILSCEKVHFLIFILTCIAECDPLRKARFEKIHTVDRCYGHGD